MTVMDISPERLQAILPKLKRRKLVPGKKLSEEEARYILHLDQIYTWVDLAAVITGKGNSVIGMQLVAAAERRFGKNLEKVLDELNKSKLKPVKDAQDCAQRSED